MFWIIAKITFVIFIFLFSIVGILISLGVLASFIEDFVCLWRQWKSEREDK